MDDGRHTTNALRRRQTTAMVILVGLLVAFGAGYLLARGGDDPTVSAGQPSASRPTHTRSPTPTVSVTPSPTPTASPDPHALPDGRSFVYAKAVVGSDGAQSLTFDLATFLTDAAAAAAATAHHDESPPPNGYYIVNDNPLLRTVPMSPTVSVRYFPLTGSGCCAHAPGTTDGFAAAVNGTAMTDYPDMRFAPWWITLKEGVIVKISQQYLP